MSKVKPFTRALLACSILTLSLLAACGGGIESVTAPQPTGKEHVEAPAEVSTTPLVVPVADPAGPSFEGYIKPFAGWSVKNTSGGTSTITAYITSFDDQKTPQASKTQVTGAGKYFEDSFNCTCVQVDLSYGGPGGRPFLFGYINHEGKVVKAGQIDRAACNPQRNPDPEPTPTPSPSPSPSPSPDPEDLCKNIDGVQTTVPEGYTRNNGGNCFPEEEEEEDPQGACFYNVPATPAVDEYCTDETFTDCKNNENVNKGYVVHHVVASITGHDQCLATPGAVSWNEQNNLCELTFPGISKDNFNLNPGQSADGCLDKQDD